MEPVDPIQSPDFSQFDKIIVSFSLALGASLLFFLPLVPSLFNPSGDALCEEAIKRTLKAPSTYKEVSVETLQNRYIIEYDAENAFGVPLRRVGTCTIENGVASWLDMTEVYRP